MEKMARTGVFADMEPYFQADNYDWSDFSQAVMDGGIWEGKRLAIPPFLLPANPLHFRKRVSGNRLFCGEPRQLPGVSGRSGKGGGQFLPKERFPLVDQIPEPHAGQRNQIFRL